jgi:hypothetical protein
MIQMKKIIYLLGVLSVGLFSCNEDNNDTLSGNEDIGGYVDVVNEAIPYVVGNGNTFNYNVRLNAIQSPIAIAKVEVYKQFFKKGEVASSAKVLLNTYNFNGTPYSENVNFTVNYNQLISGLSVSGAPLPVADNLLGIGDYFLLTYKITTASGLVRNSAETTKLAVSTRFAGNYKCTFAQYWRIGVPSTVTAADWPAVTVIESVDASTYRVKKYFGFFVNSSTATSGDYYFQVDTSDNITYPANTPDGIGQQGNLQPFLRCGEPNFQYAPCAGSNVCIRDNVSGKDQLKMSFGYYTTSGAIGSREFYQVLEKIVD